MLKSLREKLNRLGMTPIARRETFLTPKMTPQLLSMKLGHNSPRKRNGENGDSVSSELSQLALHSAAIGGVRLPIQMVSTGLYTGVNQTTVLSQKFHLPVMRLKLIILKPTTAQENQSSTTANPVMVVVLLP
jgi:hypothetical protein